MTAIERMRQDTSGKVVAAGMVPRVMRVALHSHCRLRIWVRLPQAGSTELRVTIRLIQGSSSANTRNAKNSPQLSVRCANTKRMSTY